MLYVFFGKDSYSLRERLEALRSSLDADGMLASSATVLDARKTSLAEVTAACDTVPFMSQNRLVVVEGLLSRLGGGRGRRGGEPKGDAAAWLPLAEYVERMPPSTHLVLLDGGFEGSSALLNALKGKGEVHEFRPLKQRGELAGWIRRRAQSLDVTLAPGAVGLLADFVGGDLWTLSSELEKLSAYAAGQQVSEDDVRTLVTAVREVAIFPLIDAAVEGRPAAAVRLLRQMFHQGSGAQYVMSMVQRQLRHIAIAREMLDAGESGRRIGDAVGLAGYPLDKLLEQAPRYPLRRVQSAFRRLLEADLHIKRGIYDDELALELLIQDLAEAQPAAA